MKGGMNMGAKILVPTDGSEASNNAIDYACKIAKLFGDELLILNVVRTGQTTSYHGTTIKVKLEEELTEAADHLVGKSVNRADRLGVKAESIIKQGLPDKEIVKIIKERDDLEMVIMGAYGKNFLERQIIGSKTEGVIRSMPQLDIPILVVPHSCRDVCTVTPGK
jgi:nucleotide-binding universal stress UspA family protein